MIDTKALRQKILDMAIRGKLVPQDPNDEPASVLLERIRAEKQQLIKEDKNKKDKNDSVIFKGDDNRYYEKVGSEVKDITDEIDLECPRNWTFVRLRDLIELISGRDLLPTQYNSDKIGIPYITGASNLLNERIIINRWTDTPSVVSHKGDLLITCKGTIGEMVFNNIGDIHIARQIMSIRCIGANSLFIMLVLKYYVSQLQSGAKSFIPGISRDDILKLSFIMPPLAEQTRIVNRVEELFEQVDIIEQNQADIDTLYDEFRKRTLTLAIQGKLVPQDPNDEPASVLLERIRAEKKAKLGKKYVDSYIYKGDDNCYYEKVGETVTNISNEIPFDLPENWSYSRLETMITLLSGRDLEPNQYNSQRAGIPYITGASNIEHGSLIINRWTTNSATISRKGDLLITCKGTVGTMALNNVGDIHIARQIMAINADGVCLNYIRLFLESHVRVLQNKAKSFIPGISRQDLLKAIMPIPPFNEQLRIVEQYKTIYKQLKDED